MAEQPARKPSPEQDARTTTAASADELEQRQRLDGVPDEATAAAEVEGVPPTPDVIEQRQQLTYSDEEPTFVVGTEGPLTPDMIEQRQEVGDDDRDDRRDEA